MSLSIDCRVTASVLNVHAYDKCRTYEFRPLASLDLPAIPVLLLAPTLMTAYAQIAP